VNLTKKDLTRIHEGTLRVLSQTGVSFEDPGALEVFSSHGARVEGTRVFISEEMVDSALLTVPSEFTLKSRGAVPDLTFGRGKAVFGSTSGCPYVIDANNSMRRGTMEDFENAIKLGHMLPNIDVNGYCVEPSDVSPRERAKRTLCAVLTLSDQAGELPLSSPEDLDAACGAMEILHGSGWYEHIRVFAVLNSLSPLRFTSETANAAVRLAELGQVVCPTPAAMAGFSSPATRAGTLIVQNAEVLAGLVLTQLTRPGAPFMYGSTSSIASMRTDEFLGMIRRFRGPLPTSEEAAALEVIASVGPGGSYLMEEHTLDHCRDYDRPTFFNRSNHSSWSASGGSDLGHAAEKRYQKMLQEYEPPEMDKLVKKQLREFCLGDRDSSCSI